MKDDWAEEKVRVFYPPCREKVTLRAIAHYARPGGDGVWCLYKTLSMDTGLSERTIRRHVRTLVLRGDLVAWCAVDRTRESNFFYVPIATETTTELEARTGISRRQLRLPLVHHVVPQVAVSNDVDRAGMLASVGVTLWPSPRATLALPQGHLGPLNKPRNMIEQKGRAFQMEKGRDSDYELDGPISEDTRKLIAEQLEKLRMEAALHLPARVGPGTLLREKLFGEGSDKG